MLVFLFKLKIIVLFILFESWNIVVDDGNCEFFFLYVFKLLVRLGKMFYYVILCFIVWVDIFDCDVKKIFLFLLVKVKGFNEFCLILIMFVLIVFELY